MDYDELDLLKKFGKEFLGSIQKLKRLVIHGVEVTQAIQYYRSSEHLTDGADQGADNSVRLVSGKPAWVRVYVRRQSFSGDIPGVTGTIDVSRRSFGFLYGPVGTLSPEPPGTVTARHDPLYATERETLGYSLNFIIPADLMCGNLKLAVRVSAPGGATDEHEVRISATLQQTLRVRGIMVGYNGPASLAPNAPNLTLAAPTLADLQATSAWTLLIYPVRSAATYGDAGSITWDKPLTDTPSCNGCCTPNWVALNSAVQAQKVADGNRTDVLYYGLMAVGIPMGPVIGCNSGGVSTGSNGNQETMAHELGHACGLPHSPCGVGGDPNFPVYEPYDTGGTAHAWIGEYGLNVSNGTLLSPATFKDWMSYCGPRWVSLYNYDRLVNNANLDPHIVCEDHPWILEKYKQYKPPWPPEPIPVLERRYIVTDPEPVISVIGVMHADDRIEIKSVMRLNALRQVSNGEETDLTVELLGKEGKSLARALVYRLPSLGNGGCGCEGKGQAGAHPYVFQAFLSDVEPGEALHIRRGEKELWHRSAPKEKPRVSSLAVELDKEGALVARYKVEGAGGEEYWLQWSADRGKTWHALATGLGREGVRLAGPGLPPGPVQVRLLASDGFHTAVSKSAQVRVPDRPPVVSILTPRDGQVLIAGQTMRLWGVVSTPAGEAPDIKHAFWTVDGKEAGTGLDVFVPAPPQGEHRLTLTVDTTGKQAEKTIRFATVEVPKE
jgi:hypothetical protein